MVLRNSAFNWITRITFIIGHPSASSPPAILNQKKQGSEAEQYILRPISKGNGQGMCQYRHRLLLILAYVPGQYYKLSHGSSSVLLNRSLPFLYGSYLKYLPLHFHFHLSPL